jgi:DNA-binding transcriptional LysR family regulator
MALASRPSQKSRARFREMNPSRFNFVTLSLIVSVVRAGSISAGAKAMNLALAAASKRIADFESYVGVAIFSRLPQGVELTDAGRAIFHNILNILENVELLHRNIEEIGAGGRSHVRIWVSPAAISERIPEELSRFMQAHPDITVALEERDSSDIIKAVRENRADIGIFVDAMNSNGLETRVYCEEELVVIVPADHALARAKATTLAEALTFDFVGLQSGTPLAARVDYESSRLGRTPNFKIQVRGVETTCRMVAAGLGIGILPEAAARRYLPHMGLRSIAIDEAWAKRRLFLGYRDEATLRHAARLLISYLGGERT